jgi:hypothetical protein
MSTKSDWLPQSLEKKYQHVDTNRVKFGMGADTPH